MAGKRTYSDADSVHRNTSASLVIKPKTSSIMSFVALRFVSFHSDSISLTTFQSCPTLEFSNSVCLETPFAKVYLNPTKSCTMDHLLTIR